MITVRTLGDWDLPWCEWEHISPIDAINLDRKYKILVGAEYQPSEFNFPHIILLDREQGNIEDPYSGDICYISVENPSILKGNIDSVDFDKLKMWIELNKKIILDFWYCDFISYDPSDFHDNMKVIL